jgi:hypothetical protein
MQLISKYTEGKEQKITETYKICEERRQYKRTMKETKKKFKKQKVNKIIKLVKMKVI